eukprot:Hpha_TRINITY_DN25973_c0_g1::TRINITY_DN25973_c0_g1_i1::g.185434::m.185434/K08292/EEF2K; elongation factor 2 kinase
MSMSPGVAPEGLRAIKCKKSSYDCSSGEWRTTSTYVAYAPRPFARGGMRVAHKGYEYDGEGWLPSVVKFNTVHRSSREERAACFRDSKAQAVAEFYAGMFNSLGESVREKVSFVRSDVVEFESASRVANLEPLMQGHYQKHNNNAGAVASLDATAQAFSHFTHEVSHHQLLVCDIQGVGGLYTDPQIHSVEGSQKESFGDGDLHSDGIRRFFASHRCNEQCRALGLPENKRAPSGGAASSGAFGEVGPFGGRLGGFGGEDMMRGMMEQLMRGQG